jgi:hypothetical protein
MIIEPLAGAVNYGQRRRMRRLTVGAQTSR